MSSISAALCTLLALSLVPAASAAALAGPQPTPLHFPILRRSIEKRSIEDYAAIANSIRGKYGRVPQGGSTRKRQNVANVDVTNQGADSTYFAPISVGSSGQSFNVILDTGSADLWLASNQCSSCPQGITTYNPTGSSSATVTQQSIQINYGSGSVAGTVARDTVSMGGFSVQNQVLTVVTDVTANFLQPPISGLMGLGFGTIAQSQSTPFWEALADGNSLQAPEMSFWLTRFNNDPNAQNLEPGGAFTLGGTNSSLFQGDIDFVNIPSGVSPSFWLLELQEMQVQGKSINLPTGSDGLAAIDTGTTLVAGPTSAVAEIYAQIPGSQNLTGQMQGFWSFPCSTDVTVTMGFGGAKTWSISNADFNLGSVDTRGTSCLGGIFDLDAGTNGALGSGGPGWVVGDTFLKNVYSVFRSNPPSVGFAQLSDAAGGSTAPGTGTAKITNPGPLPTPNGGPNKNGASHMSPSRSIFTLLSFLVVLWMLV